MCYILDDNYHLGGRGVGVGYYDYHIGLKTINVIVIGVVAIRL